ncbi:MAG: Fe-S cluster assembly protein SufD [Pirellulaceae bacterium]
MISKIEFNEAGFASLQDGGDAPAWINELRQTAWQKFQSLPWPSSRDEEWMRTDIRMFHIDKFSLMPDATTEIPTGLLDQGVELAGRTVTVDSVCRGHELADKWAAKGVVFGPLMKVASEHEALIRPHLMKRAFNVGFDRFAALHGAFLNSGMVLYVPRGVCIDEPLHCLTAMSDGAADLSHTLVILEDGAEATVLAESASVSGPNGTGFHCGGIELIVGQGAFLRYVNLQDWGQGVWQFGHQKAIVGQDASLQWTVGALGSRLSKVNQHVELAGRGANSQVNGVMFTENKQHLSYHTLQRHAAPDCRSDFLYKAALQDQSRTVWRGMIKVDPGAQKTDGYQRNDNLLLSENARADSIPGLEIEADDVRCTHGSTSGRVDEELIFYARSRGFTRKEAIQMIVTGFFQQVFDRITIESVREALGLAISRRVREYE